MKLTPDGFPENLSMHKLSLVVEIIRLSRLEARDRQDWEWGDDFQVLGMRAYKRQIKGFLDSQKEGLIDDLYIMDPKARATLVIDGVPIRFWRKDDPDSLVEERRMVFSQLAMQLSLLEPVDIVDRWAINYSVDGDGLLLAAELVGYCSVTNEAIRSKPIPSLAVRKARLVDVSKNLAQPEGVKKSQRRVKPRVVGKDKKQKDE